MGSENQKLNIGSKSPSVVMLVGLQGAGKTTNGAKLAGAHAQEPGQAPPARRVRRVPSRRDRAARDRRRTARSSRVPGWARATRWRSPRHAHRPRHAATATISYFSIPPDGSTSTRRSWTSCSRIKAADRTGGDPARRGRDDRPGRRRTPPQAFDDALGITGVMLTKLDGDARGGAALSVKAVTGKPIKFAGIGEKLDADRGLPPRPHGEPHSRHGRRAHAHRKGGGRPSTRRKPQELAEKLRKEPLHADRLSTTSSTPAEEHGLAAGARRDGARAWTPRRSPARTIDEKAMGAHRGDHPLHDSRRARKPRRS